MIRIMSKYRKVFISLFIVALLLTPNIIVQADGVTCEGKICNPLASKGINDLSGFIKIILEGALKLGIPVIALAIIYSGFLFVSARGNSEKLGEAKNSLMYTLIGAALLLGAWAIAKIISETVLGLG